MNEAFENPEPAFLEREYNNRALVPEFAAHLHRWAQRSANVREQRACLIDVPYGRAPSETLDVFSSSGGPHSPVVVFLHGGYWRSLDKSQHSFVAAPGGAFDAAQALVLVPNYALCPGITGQFVTIRSITLQITQALAWAWRHAASYGGDPRQIHVVGHSAGGHAAAMMLACHWPSVSLDLPCDLVKTAISISGLHDLRPIAGVPFLQDDLRLCLHEARDLSPALMSAPPQGRLAVIAGGHESSEFLRQARLMRSAWGRRIVPICDTVPGANHFTVMDSLDAADGLVARCMRTLGQTR